MKCTLEALGAGQLAESGRRPGPSATRSAMSSPCGRAISPPARRAPRWQPGTARRRQLPSDGSTGGTMPSTSLVSTPSMPAFCSYSASSAALRPFSFDLPQGLLMRIMPGFLAVDAWRWRSRPALLSTSSSTAETRNTYCSGRAVARDRSAGGPDAHERHLGAVRRTARWRGTPAHPACSNRAATFSRWTSSRAAIAPLAAIAPFVAHDQLELLAEQRRPCR